MIDISKTNYKVGSKIPVSKTHTQMLDLGGSHGLPGIELCKNFQLKACIVDLPPVKNMPKNASPKKCIYECIFLAADFMKDEIPKK
ncbi:MAG: hypothetical protein IPN14_08655 [Bacteroidetes bacterium]|nr:hypothetical protein [Bacteroidota bacterium]